MLSVAAILVMWRGHFNAKGTNANADSEAPKRRKIFTRWLNYKDVYRTARECFCKDGEHSQIKGQEALDNLISKENKTQGSALDQACWVIVAWPSLL